MGRHGARGRALGTLLAALIWGGAAAAEPVCTQNAIFLKTPAGAQMRFSAEIADDVQERAQGLMNRESLPRSAAMLFVYDQPLRATFWMKNTLIPLDMIFLDQSGVVTQVHSMAKPLDTTTIDGGEGVKFVIEINGGLAKSLGIDVGTLLLHPAVDKTSAKWPCPAG